MLSALSVIQRRETHLNCGWPNYDSYKDKVYVVTSDKLFIDNKIDYILNLKDVEWKEVESFRQIMEFDYYNHFKR